MTQSFDDRVPRRSSRAARRVPDRRSPIRNLRTARFDSRRQNRSYAASVHV